MMEAFLKYLGPSGSIATVFLSFWGLGVFLEANITPAARQDFANYLMSGRLTEAVVQLPSGMRRAFERLFGTKHFSTKCVWRSALFSLAVLVALFGLTTLHNGRSATFFWSVMLGQTKSWLYTSGVRTLMILLVAWSLCADYLSLLKTRVILLWLDSGSIKRPWVMCLTVVGDFCFSSVVFAAGLAVLEPFSIVIGSGLIGANPLFFMQFTLTMIPKLFAIGLALLPGFAVHPALGPLQYSLPFCASLVPSLWLWGWVGATLVTRMIARVGPLLRFLSYALPITDHPVRSLGFIAGSLCSIGYVVVALIF